MSGRITTRRGLLKTGLAAGLGAVAVRPAAARSNVLRVEADGGGLAAYKFTVSGDVEQVDSDDEVDGNWAAGHLGPVRGADEFKYSGELTGLTVAGPASVYRNGEWLDRDDVQQTSGSIQLQFVDSPSGTNVVEFHGGGGRPNVYEFEVSGDLRQRDSDDDADGNRAVGHVGRLRGTDTFEYTGEVTDFHFVGPGTVAHNGTVHETVYD